MHSMQEIQSPAYLIIRQGGRWNDVFRLSDGQVLVIGRASQNQIVVQDERCSRHHTEIACGPNGWFARDLGSRNGTILNGKPIVEPTFLQEGDVIQVASCQMTFVRTLGQAFRQPTDLQGAPHRTDQQTMEHPEPQTITHRKREAAWLSEKPRRDSDPQESSTKGNAGVAVQLFRLAYDLAKEQSLENAAQLALDRLLSMIGATAGGVLRCDRREKSEVADAQSLRLLATSERAGKAYHRVNDLLANTVLREGESVLARNIQDDSALIDPGMSSARRTTSVICSPIRGEEKQVKGLIHIYTSDDEASLTPEHLEIVAAVADTLAIVLANLRSQQRLTQKLKETQRQVMQLQAQVIEPPPMLARSPAMIKVDQQITRIGPTNATVLIRGESGVGKEVVARSIHQNSPRRNGPFVAINCAALSPTLLESELFGHEKGAFTGATERKVGKFELADQGTLMLDEIGEMSPEIQAKFLRALEGKPFERLGGSKPIQVNVRVVAATNRDLEKAVREHQFRADLYFRLRVIELTVPPLRHRPEDVLFLAQHFLDRFREETGHGPDGFSERAKKAMQEYDWPGNIRELKNAIERAVVLANGALAEPEDLALSYLNMNPSSSSTVSEFRERSLEEIEKDHILATLSATDGHKSKTASILGIERSTLDRKLKKYGIEAEDR